MDAVNTRTAGDFATEPEATAELDALLSRHANLFHVHREVPGFYIQPKLDGSRSNCKIDRLLIPSVELVGLGWSHGAFGIECKRSGKKIGRVVAQCMDYSRAVFTTDNGFRFMLDWVFIWPLEKQLGDIASVMAQHRIGCARRKWGGGIEFLTDSTRLISVGGGEPFVRSTSVGKKAGSR